MDYSVDCSYRPTVLSVELPLGLRNEVYNSMVRDGFPIQTILIGVISTIFSERAEQIAMTVSDVGRKAIRQGKVSRPSMNTPNERCDIVADTVSRELDFIHDNDIDGETLGELSGDLMNYEDWIVRLLTDDDVFTQLFDLCSAQSYSGDGPNIIDVEIDQESWALIYSVI